MFGWQLVFSQQLLTLSKRYYFDTSVVKDFINDTGDITKDRKIYPYIEAIGGHCVIENAIQIVTLSDIAMDLIKYNNKFKDLYNGEKFDL